MTLEETGAYIAYRLEKTGGSPALFPMDVIEKIFVAAAGIPRIINLLCDTSLVYGYADQTKDISLDLLAQVIEDKGGMGIFTKQKLNNSRHFFWGTAQSSPWLRYLDKIRDKCLWDMGNLVF